MCGGDEPLGCVVDQDDVVDSNSFDHAAVKVAVGGGEHNVLPTIFGIKQPISKRPAAPRCGSRRSLLGIEGVVEPVSERTPEPNQIRMPHRVHSRSPSLSLPLFGPVTKYHGTMGGFK